MGGDAAPTAVREKANSYAQANEMNAGFSDYTLTHVHLAISTKLYHNENYCIVLEPSGVMFLTGRQLKNRPVTCHTKSYWHEALQRSRCSSGRGRGSVPLLA